MTNVLLSVGHGYSAQALAALLLPLGWRVIATTRTVEKADAIRASGAEAVIWPDCDLVPYIAEATHFLTSVAPSAEGDPVLKACANSLRKARFEWAGYLSTTGVYGDHKGGWVDEDTDLNPSTQRGAYRKQAEANWQALGLPLHIFRLAGIYGPARGPFAKVRAGTARRIIKKDQLFSRIHVDDIAAVLMASINAPNPNRIYNVCDDFAAPPQDVIGYAAELLGVSMPVAEDFETAQMRPMARSFYAESKKVSNRRIKEELGVVLKYPTYREGLQALIAQEKSAD